MGLYNKHVCVFLLWSYLGRRSNPKRLMHGQGQHLRAREKSSRCHRSPEIRCCRRASLLKCQECPKVTITAHNHVDVMKYDEIWNAICGSYHCTIPSHSIHFTSHQIAPYYWPVWIQLVAKLDRQDLRQPLLLKSLKCRFILQKAIGQLCEECGGLLHFLWLTNRAFDKSSVASW